MLPHSEGDCPFGHPKVNRPITHRKKRDRASALSRNNWPKITDQTLDTPKSVGNRGQLSSTNVPDIGSCHLISPYLPMAATPSKTHGASTPTMRVRAPPGKQFLSGSRIMWLFPRGSATLLPFSGDGAGQVSWSCVPTYLRAGAGATSLVMRRVGDSSGIRALEERAYVTRLHALPCGRR